MNSLLVGLLIYAFLVGGAIADTVIIRSADHLNFTRVALDLAQPNAVSVRQDGRILSVELPHNLNSEGVEKFFDRISRDRVLAFEISSEKRGFRIDLACDCTFKTFIAGSKTFVIDVFDAGIVDAGQQAKTTKWAKFDRIHEGSLVFSTSAPAPGLEATPRVVVQPAIKLQRRDFPMRRLLSALDLARDAQPSLQDTVSDEIENVPMQITFRSLPVTQNLVLADLEQEARLDIQKCKHSEILNPANWPKYENAKEFLRGRRNQLASEVDRFDDNAKRELALTYLSLSLGAEALAILSALQAPNEIDKQLVYLSTFVDGEEDSLSDDWSDVAFRCPELRLWTVLQDAESENSGMTLRQMSAEQKKIMRNQFEDWPSALKGVFSPRLAAAFFEAGDMDFATFTLRKIADATALSTGERELIAARISGSQGNTEEAIEILRPVIASDVDAAPEAVVAISDLLTEQGDILGEPEKNALETYQEELKGTEIEPELLRARIAASLQDKDFEAVILLVNDYSKLVRASKVNVVLDELGFGILNISSDVTFLKEAVSLPSGYFNALGPDAQAQIKARVIALGFNDLAMQLGQRSAQAREVETSDGSAKRLMNDTQDLLRAESSGRIWRPATYESDLAAIQKQNKVEGLRAGQASKTNPLLIRNATPLDEAIGETQLILDGMAKLKDQIIALGF